MFRYLGVSYTYSWRSLGVQKAERVIPMQLSHPYLNDPPVLTQALSARCSHAGFPRPSRQGKVRPTASHGEMQVGCTPAPRNVLPGSLRLGTTP